LVFELGAYGHVSEQDRSQDGRGDSDGGADGGRQRERLRESLARCAKQVRTQLAGQVLNYCRRAAERVPRRLRHYGGDATRDPIAHPTAIYRSDDATKHRNAKCPAELETGI